ncbi:YciI family protein [Actinocorallia libanotica]|uniref:YciI family protein n=2 Tax=Actinocorallia libanotica TaxID=46162 RepID=A0ABP4C3W9_9ACTN
MSSRAGRLRLRGESAPEGRAERKATAMKYLLMIYGNQEKWDSIPAEEWPEAIARQDAFNRKYRETGELVGAYGLADAVNARLVRRENGAPAVTDGPYLETKEYMASFYLLDCESEERALQIAAEIPSADQDAVEFWPVLHEAPADA